MLNDEQIESLWYKVEQYAKEVYLKKNQRDIISSDELQIISSLSPINQLNVSSSSSNNSLSDHALMNSTMKSKTAFDSFFWQPDDDEEVNNNEVFNETDSTNIDAQIKAEIVMLSKR